MQSPARFPPILLFYLVSFGLTWSIWIPEILAAYGWINLTVPFWLSNAAYFIGPPAGALVVTYAVGGRAAVQALLGRFLLWRVAWWWYALACLIRPGILLISLGLWSLVSGSAPDWTATLRLLPLVPIDFALRFFAHSGEELGWRGYLLPQLRERIGFLGVSSILGLTITLWHLPLFWIPGHGQMDFSVIWFVLWLIAITIIQTWISNNTRDSLLIACIFHSALNTTLGVFPGVPAVLEILVTAVVAVGLVLWMRTATRTSGFLMRWEG